MTQGNWKTASDSELLKACHDGETGAYAVLWERHHHAGEAAARGIAPTLDAGDLVSSAYLKILELIADGRGPSGAFRPYLYKVIRTLAADEYRSPEDPSDNLEQIPDLTEAGPWEDGAFDRNAAAQAFAGLNERWQAVLWYTVVEGLPPRKAAVLLGMSANSVSALAVRAREALQSGWVEAHVNRELAAAECQATLSHLQRYERGKLTAALRREVESHLDHCDTCPLAVAEYSLLNRKLALVLASLFVGGGAAGSLLGAFGTAAPAMATVGAVAGGSGTTSGSAGGGLGASGSTLVGGLTGPAGLIASAAVAAVAVVIGGVIVASNVFGGGLSEATVAEATTSERRPASESEDQEADTSLRSAKPAEEQTKSEGSTEVSPAAPVAPEPLADPLPEQGGTSGSVPDPAAPAPTPQPPPEPTPTPTPEPEPELPVFDPTLVPGSVTCNTAQNGVAGTFLYGFANRSLQSAQIRAIQGSGGQAVLLPQGVVERWGHLWMTSSMTPLSQWPGLGDTPALNDPANPTILEIQLTDLNGSISEWTRLDVATCN